MAPTLQVAGNAVALVARPFDGFMDRGTGQEVAAGHTYWLWLSSSFGAEPVAVRVSRNQYELLRERLIPGGALAVEVEARAKANRVVWWLVSMANPDTGEVVELSDPAPVGA